MGPSPACSPFNSAQNEVFWCSSVEYFRAYSAHSWCSVTPMHNEAAAGISATREVSHSSLHFCQFCVTKLSIASRPTIWRLLMQKKKRNPSGNLWDITNFVTSCLLAKNWPGQVRSRSYDVTRGTTSGSFSNKVVFSRNLTWRHWCKW